MINHHLLLKVFQRISSGSSLNRLCYLDVTMEMPLELKCHSAKDIYGWEFILSIIWENLELPGSPGSLNLFQCTISYFWKYEMDTV